MRKLNINPWNIITLFLLLWTSKISPTTHNLVSFKNFSPEEENSILSVLKDLEVYQKKAMFIQKKELEVYVLGITYLQDIECYIDLSPLIFKGMDNVYFKPVVYHEIGHCFGLEHTDNKNDVMWQEARNVKEYTQLDWDRFKAQLKSCF